MLASASLCHNLLKTLSWIELRSALVLAAMTPSGCLFFRTMPLTHGAVLIHVKSGSSRSWSATIFVYGLRRGSRARLVKRIAGGRPGRCGRFIDRRDGELRAKSTPLVRSHCRWPERQAVAAVVALLRVLTVTLFISPPVFPELSCQ